MERIVDEDVDQCDKVVEAEGRLGKYQEKPSLYDRYLRRDCKIQPQIQNLCYAQFVKRYQAAGKISENFDFTPITVTKPLNDDGTPVLDNLIITKDFDGSDTAVQLPGYIVVNRLKPGELPYMKLRSPQVLHYHKFNREKNPHEYLYSELLLYHPHSRKGVTLDKERDDIEICQHTYHSSQIYKVKSKIMEFLESVEEGLEKAQQLQNTIGDQMDLQNEQDNEECEVEGVQSHPDFISSDPGRLPREEASPSTGLFKKVVLAPDEELERLTHQLDEDQLLVLNKVLSYAKKIQISRKIPGQIQPPLIIVQGGAGAGKNLLIRAIAQWFEKLLRQAGDDREKPYVLMFS